MSDFLALGHWLFSGLGARRSCCLRQPDRKLIFGAFNPAAPSDRLLVSAEQFEGRYALPFTNAGSLIGEGRVPDRSELQERVQRSDNPCGLASNASYVVTEADYTDLRYVALSGRPVWEMIEVLGIFAAAPLPPLPPPAPPPTSPPAPPAAAPGLSAVEQRTAEVLALIRQVLVLGTAPPWVARLHDATVAIGLLPLLVGHTIRIKRKILDEVT